jgi:hypothetical protein
MYNHVLPCTAMYCHVLPCTAKSTYLYVLIRTFGHLSISIRTGTYRNVQPCKNSPNVRTSTYTMRVQGGTRRYIPVSTGTYHQPAVQDTRRLTLANLFFLERKRRSAAKLVEQSLGYYYLSKMELFCLRPQYA